MIWLKQNYEKNPDKKFINELSYKDVYIKVIELLPKLASFVASEKRVALYTTNEKESIIVLFALLLLKREVLMLNTRLTDIEIENQTKELGINVIFSYNDKYISYEQIFKQQDEDIDYSWEMNRDDIAVIMNTSATTGKFKSVPIRWEQIISHVEASSQTLGINEEDNWLVILPIFHISGLSIIFRNLYNNTQITIIPKFVEEKVLELINKSTINTISIVPTMLKKIYKQIHYNSLRVILLGGEFIPDDLIKQCIKQKLPIYKTYGMTETTSQSTTFSVLDYPDKFGAVGKPLPGVKVLIKNTDKNGVGEIHLQSPMLMRGYLGQKDIIGFFNTEDVGYVDSDGFLYVLNRRKDIIISGGENIYPKEIEDLLYKMPEVVECAVVAEKDDIWGQIPVLFIVSYLSKSEIINYLSGIIAKYKIPKKIYYKDGLPRNASGKIQRSLLLGGVEIEN